MYFLNILFVCKIIRKDWVQLLYDKCHLICINALGLEGILVFSYFCHDFPWALQYILHMTVNEQSALYAAGKPFYSMNF